MPPKQRRGPGGRRRSRKHSQGARDSDIAGDSGRQRRNGGSRRSKRSSKEQKRHKPAPVTETDLDAALDSYFGKVPKRQKEQLNDDLDSYFANKDAAGEDAAPAEGAGGEAGNETAGKAGDEAAVEAGDAAGSPAAEGEGGAEEEGAEEA